MFIINLESSNSEFSELTIFMEELKEQNCELKVIYLQECWLSDSDDTEHININGYHTIIQGRSCSDKGGFIIYLQNIYDYKILSQFNIFDFGEGVFIEVSGGGMQNKILIGNIYIDHQESY